MTASSVGLPSIVSAAVSPGASLRPESVTSRVVALATGSSVGALGGVLSTTNPFDTPGCPLVGVRRSSTVSPFAVGRSANVSQTIRLFAPEVWANRSPVSAVGSAETQSPPFTRYSTVTETGVGAG